MEYKLFIGTLQRYNFPINHLIQRAALGDINAWVGASRLD